MNVSTKDLTPGRTELLIGAVLIGVSALSMSMVPDWSVWVLLCWMGGLCGAGVISWFAGIKAAEIEVRRLEEEAKTLHWLIEQERAVGSRDLTRDLNARISHARPSENN